MNETRNLVLAELTLLIHSRISVSETLDAIENIVKSAVEDEREECAKLCDLIGKDWKEHEHGDILKFYAAEYLSNQIRRRGEA